MRKLTFINMYIGHRVKLRRLAKKQSLEDLAKLLQLSPNEYRALETGYRSFSNTQLIALAGYFSVPFSDFFPKPTELRPDFDHPGIGIKFKYIEGGKKD